MPSARRGGKGESDNEEARRPCRRADGEASRLSFNAFLFWGSRCIAARRRAASKRQPTGGSNKAAVFFLRKRHGLIQPPQRPGTARGQTRTRSRPWAVGRAPRRRVVLVKALAGVERGRHQVVGMTPVAGDGERSSDCSCLLVGGGTGFGGRLTLPLLGREPRGGRTAIVGMTPRRGLGAGRPPARRLKAACLGACGCGRRSSAPARPETFRKETLRYAGRHACDCRRPFWSRDPVGSASAGGGGVVGDARAGR